MTEIAPDLQVSVPAAGVVTGAYALGVVLTVLPLTRLMLRFSRRTGLITTLVMFAVCNVIVCAAPTIQPAAAGRFLGGASHGLMWAILPAVVLRMCGPEHARRGMTVVLAGNSFALAGGAPLGAILGAWVGWRVAFAIAGIVAIALAGLVALMIRPYTSELGSQVPFLTAVRTAGALRLCGVWGVLTLGHFAVLTYLAPLMQRLGLHGPLVGASLTVLGVAGVIGLAGASALSRRSLFAVLVGAPVAIAAAFGLLAVVPPSVPVVLGVLALWGAGFAGMAFGYQQAVLAVGRSAPETTTSMAIVVSQTGIVLGASAGGLGIELLGLAALPLVGLCCMLGALPLLRGVKRILRA